MPYKIEIRPLAVMEIIEAFDWYEEQRAGLGDEFLEELDNLYKILSTNPLTYSYFEQPIREGKINRFPYTVVYEAIGDIIIIYSVFMSRQHPAKKRIR